MAFAFAASPAADDRLAFSWTAVAGPDERPTTSGKLRSLDLPALDTSLTKTTLSLTSSASRRSPRTSSLYSPASESAGPSSSPPGARLLPAFPLSHTHSGADSFSAGSPDGGWAPGALRLEGFVNRFPVETRRGSGSSYQSSSTVRSSGSSADFDGLGLVGPGLSTLSLSSGLSSASSPGPASPAGQGCEDVALTPRLVGSPMCVDEAAAGAGEAGAEPGAEADPFEDDDDLNSFLQSLPAWHGGSAAIATKDFKPADDDFYWQDLEDSVQIDLDSCPTTPRAGAHSSLSAHSRRPYGYYAARSPARSPGKGPRRTSSINSYSSRRSSAYGHSGYATPSAVSVRSFGSPVASRSSLTLRQPPGASVPPSPLAAGRKGKGKASGKAAKAGKVKKAKKVRPPMPEKGKYTAEGFDASALDAFFGIRPPKAEQGVEIWRRGSASATAPLLGPEGDDLQGYCSGRRRSELSESSSLTTRLDPPVSPRRAPPPAPLDIAAAQQRRSPSPSSRAYPLSATLPRQSQRSTSPALNYARRGSEGGLLLGLGASQAGGGAGKGWARAYTAGGPQGRLVEEEEHALRKKASLGAKLMKALYGGEGRGQEWEV